MYNVKTQYQYREDMKKAYDNVLLDIINPIWDKVEDILNAPLETLFEMLPNLALSSVITDFARFLTISSLLSLHL